MGKADKKQAGLAAIVVTSAFIVIMSLIAIGFSLVTRNAQTNTLDRQLSKQASLAAETGLSAVAAKLAALGPTDPIPEKNTCQPNTDYPQITLSAAPGPDVVVSCLLVDNTPNNYVTTGIGDSNPQVVEIATVNPAGSLELVWKYSGPQTNDSCAKDNTRLYTRPSNSQWTCAAGILRVDIAEGLNSNFARSAFFYPYTSGASSSVAISSITETGTPWFDGSCAGKRGSSTCKVTLTGLKTTEKYFLAVRSLYLNSDLTVNALSASNPGNTVDFTNQITVDATGRAGDVLRRVQGRLSSNFKSTNGSMASTTPGFALQAQDDLCKKYSVWPQGFSEDPSLPQSCRLSP